MITKDELKRITDEAIGVSSSFVEATLEPREFYIYTEVWFITTEQLKALGEELKMTDYGQYLLTIAEEAK